MLVCLIVSHLPLLLVSTKPRSVFDSWRKEVYPLTPNGRPYSTGLSLSSTLIPVGETYPDGIGSSRQLCIGCLSTQGSVYEGPTPQWNEERRYSSPVSTQEFPYRGRYEVTGGVRWWGPWRDPNLHCPVTWDDPPQVRYYRVVLKEYSVFRVPRWRSPQGGGYQETRERKTNP